MNRILSSTCRAATVAAATAALWAQPVWGQAPAALAGTVKRVTGQALLERAGQPALVLAPGQVLLPGDTVRTTAGSSVAITLADDTRLAAGPNSQLVINAFSFDSTTQDGHMLLKLWHGTLSVVTGLIAKRSPDKVNVQTRNVVLGVRGTEFIVEAGSDTP